MGSTMSSGFSNASTALMSSCDEHESVVASIYANRGSRPTYRRGNDMFYQEGNKCIQCSHCGMIGHIAHKCYRKHDFSPGFKFKNQENTVETQEGQFEPNFSEQGLHAYSSQSSPMQQPHLLTPDDVVSGMVGKKAS